MFSTPPVGARGRLQGPPAAREEQRNPQPPAHVGTTLAFDGSFIVDYAAPSARGHDDLDGTEATSP